MLNATLKYLRDPVWQAVGALVAVIALFITVAPTEPAIVGDSELSIIHTHGIKFDQFLISSDSIQIIAGKSKQDPANLEIEYFQITNTSSKPIYPTDFAESLSVTNVKGKKPLIAVQSCSSQLAMSGNAACMPNRITLVPFAWVEKNGIWSAAPSLMNPKDSSCVLLVSLKSETQSKGFLERFHWNARIAGFNVRTYESLAEYDLRVTPPNWKKYFWIEVTLGGWGIAWFVVLQITFIALTSYLGLASGWIVGARRRDIIRFITLALFATTTSEILVDIFVNRRPFQELHAVCVPLLLAHFALFAYLIRINARKTALRVL